MEEGRRGGKMEEDERKGEVSWNKKEGGEKGGGEEERKWQKMMNRWTEKEARDIWPPGKERSKGGGRSDRRKEDK